MLRTLGDRYQPTEFVGGGETGDVWQAVDRVTGRPVALKVLHSRLVTDLRLVDRLLRSRSALTALWHPHIVQLLDLVVEEDSVALVTELVDGTDLRQWLAEHGPMAPAQAAEVVATVADALDTAHRAGVVHGDVKPSNILVPPPYGGPIRVTDFALAMLVRAGRRTGPVGHLAPEVADGAIPTASSDIYSLGMLLRELVPDSPELLAIAQRCIAPSEGLRPSAADVSDRLWKVIPTLPGPVQAPARTAALVPRTPVRRPPPRRTRATGIAAAVALVVVGVLVAVWALSGPRSDPSGGTQNGTLPTTVGAPVLPAAAATRSELGANEFVRHWFATLTYAEQTGDTAPLDRITGPACAQCRTAMETIRSAYADGGSLRGGVYVVRSVAVNSLLNLERPVYEATVDRGDRSSVDRAGALRSTLPGLSFSNCILVLEWADGGWRVFEVTSVGCVA